MTETKQTKIEWNGESIPIQLWGKDHWSTLLYIETRCVDYKGKPEADRMRTEPGRIRRGHHKRGLDGEESRRPSPENATRYPTRLNNGTEVFGHDDFDCASDMEKAGLLEWQGTGLHPTFKLTDLGWQIAGLLRRHVADGNPSAKFSAFPVRLHADSTVNLGPQHGLAIAAADAGAQCTEPEPQIDDTIEVDHTRKGTFRMRITSMDPEWIQGVIVSGKTKALLPENVREEGEKIGVRRSLCSHIRRIA